MVPKWYRRARRFILQQRQTELQKAIKRYPLSERYQMRCEELLSIETELKELEAELVSAS
jgi:hypothetical protein